jgi:hypothetical protein
MTLRLPRNRTLVAVLLAAGMAGSAVAMVARSNDCEAEQEALLLAGPYRAVPDRASYAAGVLCNAHHGRPVASGRMTQSR